MIFKSFQSWQAQTYTYIYIFLLVTSTEAGKNFLHVKLYKLEVSRPNPKVNITEHIHNRLFSGKKPQTKPKQTPCLSDRKNSPSHQPSTYT